MWQPPRRPQSPLAPRPSPTTTATRVRAEVSVAGRRSETLEGGGCRLEEIEGGGSGWRCCGGSRWAEVGGAGSGWKKACGGGESEGHEVGRTTCAVATVAHRGGGRRSAPTTGEATSSGKRRRGSRRRSASRSKGCSTPAKKIRISARAWLASESKRLCQALLSLISSVESKMADIRKLVVENLSHNNSLMPAMDDMYEALVRVDELAEEMDHLAIQTREVAEADIIPT